MWIITDWHHTKFYGPFLERRHAQDWLRKQGIASKDFDVRELSISPVIDPDGERVQHQQ